jgi:hypothetical protein
MRHMSNVLRHLDAGRLTYVPYHAHMVVTRRPPVLPGVMALCVMCGLIFSLGVWLFLPDLIKVMTGRLVPPAFPGAEQVDHAERLEFGTATEETTFRAHAQVYAVRPWMEQRMPGFTTCATDTSYLPDCSSNIICDTSIISKTLIWMLLGENGRHSEACVAVIILPMPTDERYTLIRYTLSWPAVEEQTQ